MFLCCKKYHLNRQKNSLHKDIFQIIYVREIFILAYSMSKKSCFFLYSEPLYQNRQDFWVMQYMSYSCIMCAINISSPMFING